MSENLVLNNTDILFIDDYQQLSESIGNLGSSVLWVFDSNTARMVRPLPEPSIIIEPGDGSKNFQTLERIITGAFENRFDKKSCFLAMGGGTVCDITGLACSLYLNGCKLVYVPTTLQAMSDSVIGNEVNINFKNIKNIIGTKYKPSNVLICPALLKSLPQTEYRNGLAEIIKHGLISKYPELINFIKENRQNIIDRNLEIITKLIKLSLNVKSQILSDPDCSYYLSLGHTFAYAIESLANISHGNSVEWGLCRALELSKELNLCDPGFYTQTLNIFKDFNFDTNFRISRGEWQAFRKIMFRDNKTVDGNINFVILTDQGKCIKQSVDEEIIKELVIRALGE